MEDEEDKTTRGHQKEGQSEDEEEKPSEEEGAEDEEQPELPSGLTGIDARSMSRGSGCGSAAFDWL